MTIKKYEGFSDIFANLFHEISKFEAKLIITEEFKDITKNEMHVIAAIGLSVDNTMSAVAKKLGITAGSLTTSINHLVNKKYVFRERGKVDRRKVYISLSEKGQKAFKHHINFHKKLTEAVVSSLNQEEIQVLQKSFNDLFAFFKSYTGTGKKNKEM